MSFTLIKNASVYDPVDVGRQDVLLVGEKIVAMAPTLDPLPSWAEGTVIDAGGKLLTPGLIDLHEHLIGGGGEMGPRSRTPEANLTDISTAGVTTVVGVLGTDAATRHVSSLLAKVRALESEGLTTYMYTGAYMLPSPTITGSVQNDVALIDKVVGVKVAVSDHRSSEPAFEELARLASQARLGGMLGGKAGLVHVHVGAGKRVLGPLLDVVERTDIPITQFLPTHMGRTGEKLRQTLEWLRIGGFIDLTASAGRASAGDEYPPRRVLKMILESQIDPSLVSWSTDAQGSFPRWDPATGTKAIGLGVGRAHTLLEEVRLAVQEEALGLGEVLPLVTVNPAARLGLSSVKGRVGVGYDADLLLLDPGSLVIDCVWSRGQQMVSGGAPIAFGMF